jgi:hypothetical protein
MIYCALQIVLSIVALLGLLTASQSASSCFEPEGMKSHEIPSELSSTRTTPLRLGAYEIQGEYGKEMRCSAAISVPLSVYPSVRLVARPTDFASHIREQVAEWDLSECSVIVWIENDTGEELTNAESCLVETFRYDGDSVWSAGRESTCEEAEFY